MFYIGSLVGITTRDDGEPTSRVVRFNPSAGGTELTIELPDLHLRLAPTRGTTSFRLCDHPQGEASTNVSRSD